MRTYLVFVQGTETPLATINVNDNASDHAIANAARNKRSVRAALGRRRGWSPHFREQPQRGAIPALNTITFTPDTED